MVTYFEFLISNPVEVNKGLGRVSVLYRNGFIAFGPLLEAVQAALLFQALDAFGRA